MNRRITLRPAGFTLFEVILALTIFVLLAGAVYFSVSASIQAGTLLGDYQLTARKLDSCERFIREGFRNLPAESEFELRSRDLGRAGRSIDLLIWQASAGFDVSGLEAGGSGVVLAALPDGKGKARLSLARFPERISDGELERLLMKTEWITLLEDVDKARWRFWDANANSFVELWKKGNGRPEMIELTFAAGSQEAKVCVFSLPPIKKRMASATRQPHQ